MADADAVMQPERYRLLHGYNVYDRAVDIVSAFEALFTRQQEIAAEVVHFDRYPAVRHADGRLATPDFSVVFNDGSALVGEILNLATHDNSVEKACAQLLRYDALTCLPGPSRQLANVSAVDVLVLVPGELINDAVDRIITERLLAEDHSYKPVRTPMIVSASRDASKYAFVRSRDPANGTIAQPLVFDFLNKSGYKAPGQFWTPVKGDQPFINDSVDPLYLAAILWIKVLPSMFPGQRDFETTTAQIAQTLRSQYTRAPKTAEVRRAMTLLHRGGYAQEISGAPGEWSIRRRAFAGGDGDFVHQLVDRVTTPRQQTAPRRAPVGRRLRRSYSENQGVLFDPLGSVD